jgi:lipopolysaccharide export system protein LptA
MRHARRLVSLILALTFGGPAWALESDPEEPIYIEANSGTYDEKKGESVYTGDVQVTQGSIVINADQMTVYQKNNKTDHIVATGNPVRFKQTPSQGKQDIHGVAMRAEYYAERSRLLLFDKAVIYQEQNTYASDYIEYDSKTSIVRAGQPRSGDKRVRVKIQPKT